MIYFMTTKIRQNKLFNVVYAGASSVGYWGCCTLGCFIAVIIVWSFIHNSTSTSQLILLVLQLIACVVGFELMDSEVKNSYKTLMSIKSINDLLFINDMREVDDKNYLINKIIDKVKSLPEWIVKTAAAVIIGMIGVWTTQYANENSLKNLIDYVFTICTVDFFDSALLAILLISAVVFATLYSIKKMYLIYKVFEKDAIKIAKENKKNNNKIILP